MILKRFASSLVEPKSPVIASGLRGNVSSIPGPRSKAEMKVLNGIQDARTVFFVSDLLKSQGNYIADIDGNLFLDMHCMIASIAVGYNHPRLLEEAKSELWSRVLLNRPALGLVPPQAGWIDSLVSRDGGGSSSSHVGLMDVAPKGLKNVFTAMCGSCANEIALKAAFMHLGQQLRQGSDVTTLPDLMTSCMKNEAPGSPDFAVLSFEGGFHGRLFGSLSLTRSKAIHKVDIPAFGNWPAAPFPRIRYGGSPGEFEAENAAEEARCLEATEVILKTRNEKGKGSRIAAMIVEPIQGEGGDNHASPLFFQGLQRLCKKYNCLFIVDEVQTGVCSTGHFWCHESWNLSSPPDIVTFAKKMQLAGFYHSDALRPSHPYRNFNTWMGDPIRLLQCQSILSIIKEEKLQEKVNQVSPMLRSGLVQLSRDHGRWIRDIRGMGTFFAWNCGNAKDRDLLVLKLRSLGVHMGPCGDCGIRVRPSLIFGPDHCRLFLEILEEALISLSKQ